MAKFMQKKPDRIFLSGSDASASIEDHYVLCSFGILRNGPLFLVVSIAVANND